MTSCSNICNQPIATLAAALILFTTTTAATVSALFAQAATAEPVETPPNSAATQAVHSESTLTIPAYTISVIAETLEHPWSLAFLPDGRLLITERPGRLRLIDGNTLSTPIDNVPPVYAKSQGGLFDVVLHPDYANNGWLYLSYAHGDKHANATRLLRARLVDDALTDIEVLFTASPWKDTPVHYGGRLAFLPDNTLLLSIGDGFDYREQAQQLDSYLGKLVRLNDDGSIPADNPFVGVDGALPGIWSYGHRNAQAIVIDHDNQRVLEHEHGPAGGDEINWISRGGNYGWPVTTYGRDYSGAAISPFQRHVGTEDPVLHWTPSIAPAGMAIMAGDAFPELRGDLLVAALKAREVRRVKLDGEQVVAQQSLFTELQQRIRDVREAPDGSIYLLTDSANGQVLRITPAQPK